jgi:hypothetical protein
MHAIKKLLPQTNWVGTSLGFCFALIILLAALAPSGYSDPPSLVGGPLTNGIFNLAITNGAPGIYYEIEWRVGLEEEFSWQPLATGTNGQTNFVIAVGPVTRGFFRAVQCTDCDSDGVPNIRDAHPTDASIGQLSITIISPANGSTIN